MSGETIISTLDKYLVTGGIFVELLATKQQVKSDRVSIILLMHLHLIYLLLPCCPSYSLYLLHVHY